MYIILDMNALLSHLDIIPELKLLQAHHQLSSINNQIHFFAVDQLTVNQITLDQLESYYLQKPISYTLNSKIVKALAIILTRSNIERILIITQSSLPIENFNTFLALCSFAAQNKIRIDLFEFEQGQSDIIKQGIQLTNGIYHGGGDPFSSFMLGFLNPGDQLGFKQPKIQELQYEAYCICCDKLVKQAKACSKCLKKCLNCGVQFIDNNTF